MRSCHSSHLSIFTRGRLESGESDKSLGPLRRRGHEQAGIALAVTTGKKMERHRCRAAGIRHPRLLIFSTIMLWYAFCNCHAFARFGNIAMCHGAATHDHSEMVGGSGFRLWTIGMYIAQNKLAYDFGFEISDNDIGYHEVSTI